MTTSGRHPLPDAAESLLAGWPAPSKSALEWEEFADRTVRAARDAAGTADSAADDALFAAPLPLEDGEGSVAAAPLPTSEPEEPGLLSIAKKVVAASAGSSPKEIALAGLQAADAGRRDAPQGAPPRPPTRAEHEAQAVAGLMGRVAATSRAAGPEPVRPVAVARGAHQPVEAAAHSEVPAAARSRSKTPWAAITGGGLALAAAAAFALLVGTTQHKEAAVTAAAPVEPPATVAAAQRAAPAVEPAPIASQASELESLPLADVPKDDALSFRVEKSAPASNQIVLEKKAPIAATPRAVSKKAKSLSEAMEAAAGDKAAPKAPASKPVAQVAQEPLPDRPTIGDAQAAAGPALMKARMCLAGQEAGSQAKLTFGSDGRVKSVAISGPAAGTPAESCLRSQLSSARVPPFAESSFSFSLTVRPP